MNVAIPSALKQFIAMQLSSKEDDWWVRDLRKSYPWLKNSVVYWVIDSQSDTSIMILERGSQHYERLNCSAGLGLISAVIRKDLGEVPTKDFEPDDLARLLMQWYHEPRGYVATPVFLEKKQRELSDWLVGKEKDPKALRDICRTPVYTRKDDGSWSLVFNVINHKGGVEEWNASGRIHEFDIHTITVRILKENGTFYYPDEL